MRVPTPLLLVLLAVAAASSARAQAGDDPSPYSEARLVADVSRVAPGDTFDVALVIDVEPGWHIYWQNPGDSGQPVSVTWTLPEGATAGPLRFPVPGRYEEAGLVTYAHDGSPAFLTRLTAPASAAGEVRIEGEARWLICSDICVPAHQSVALDVPVGVTERTDALDAARSALPADGSDWTASATADGGAYVLRVTPPAGVALDGATFFVDQPSVLDHAAPQAFEADGDAWMVRLAGSSYAQATADTLGGVLAVGDRAVALRAPVTATATAAASGGEAATLGLGAALLFAFLGGVILNLMPCVFPILSIKILGFVKDRDASARTLRAHGLAFGAGVVVSFLVLAGVLLALKATGDGSGWGFQLKYPAVVAGLALLMTGLALNLLGVFEVGHRVAAVGGRLDRREGLSGAFLSGVLATVVASPCTAPLMGGAIGFALVQPAVVALAVFGALGVGMALPYVLLSFKPDWLDRLPRPGAWMETLKQILAFPLLATAVWLVWLFGSLRGLDAAAMLLLALVVAGVAAWAWGRWPGHGVRGKAFRAARASSLITGAVAVWLVVVSLTPARDDWRPFEAGAVQALVASGEPVFIDFTATWCLTCQVNKKTTLHTGGVRDAFASAGVTTVRADWTRQDPEITAYLDRFGRRSVPLYVLYPGGGAEPVVLPEVLTPRIVLDALATAQQTASR